MELRQPWVVWAGLLAVALVAGAVWLLRRRRRRRATTVALANTDVLRSLPEYQRTMRRHRWRVAALAGCAGALATASVLGAARPVGRTTIDTQRSNRDVVLCLDVSGSMSDADAEVIRTFRSLARGFQGERLSLVLFNSSAVPVFPLTDDYSFVDEELTRGERAFEVSDESFLAGTDNGQGSSLIGDGLATCVRAFDHPELRRARSVIFATDNELAGKPLFSLAEAGALASEGGVQIYGLNPSDSPSSSSREMRTVVESTGGIYYPLRRRGAVEQILASVSAREAGRLPIPPRLVLQDQPTETVLLGSVALLALLASRRRWPR